MNVLYGRDWDVLYNSGEVGGEGTLNERCQNARPDSGYFKANLKTHLKNKSYLCKAGLALSYLCKEIGDFALHK